VTALWLSLLALLDGLLVGMRAAAGRDGRVRKVGYYTRAQLAGLCAAAGVVGAAWLLAVGLRAEADDPDELWNDWMAAGWPALVCWGAYAAVAVLALGVYLWAALVRHSTELRTWATVLVLGPFTLARPAVILAGLGLAVWTRPRPEVIVVAAFAAVAILSLEPALRALRRKQVDRLHQEIRRDQGRGQS
jgi:hypothetical protein